MNDMRHAVKSEKTGFAGMKEEGSPSGKIAACSCMSKDSSCIEPYLYENDGGDDVYILKYLHGYVVDGLFYS